MIFSFSQANTDKAREAIAALQRIQGGLGSLPNTPASPAPPATAVSVSVSSETSRCEKLKWRGSESVALLFPSGEKSRGCWALKQRCRREISPSAQTVLAPF
jgi:hypothetical protein